MTDLRAAAQQALEALETLMLERGSIYDTAITALREALAQEHALHELARLGQEIEQEPVAMLFGSLPVYDTAAQRPWQGLTGEEVQFYIKKHSKLVNAGYDKVTDTNLVAKTFDSTGFYKEVSTVLKERNT
jgi:hypothetical protein